jgi:hypothetical protein
MSEEYDEEYEEKRTLYFNPARIKMMNGEKLSSEEWDKALGVDGLGTPREETEDEKIERIVKKVLRDEGLLN